MQAHVSLYFVYILALDITNEGFKPAHIYLPVSKRKLLWLCFVIGGP